MNVILVPILAAGLLAGLSPLALAGDAESEEVRVEKRVIALKTDDFELQETDVSHLAVGDAETIVTDDGRTIDILRTAEGVEVYLDGELVAPAVHDDGAMHGDHEVMHKRVEVHCGDEGECEKTVWVTDGEDIDLEALEAEGHHDGEHEKRVIVIRKEKTIDG